MALARWLSWLKHCPVHRKVVGSVPGQAHTQVAGLIPAQGVYRRQLIDVSLSHLSLSLSLSHPTLPLSKINKHILR